MTSSGQNHKTLKIGRVSIRNNKIILKTLHPGLFWRSTPSSIILDLKYFNLEINIIVHHPKPWIFQFGDQNYRPWSLILNISVWRSTPSSNILDLEYFSLEINTIVHHPWSWIFQFGDQHHRPSSLILNISVWRSTPGTANSVQGEA